MLLSFGTFGTGRREGAPFVLGARCGRMRLDKAVINNWCLLAMFRGGTGDVLEVAINQPLPKTRQCFARVRLPVYHKAAAGWSLILNNVIHGARSW